jgi:uncharacterized membrane protein YeiB
MIFVCYLGIPISIPAFAASHQVNSTSNFIDEMPLQKSLTSNQSSDIKDIKRLTSEEVQLLKIQLLKSMGQEFSKTATQGQFAALGVFLLGISLLIYGLRLTLKATDKQTSRYFKAMIWALIIPVITLIAVYQIGILLGSPILIYRANEPFFFISLLLLIPAAIILFLLIAERKLIGALYHKDQQQQGRP